jgi:ubiquinone/menaquinone biosynthesis C-methylase UbiE
MKEYKPRDYWPERLKKEGSKYVGSRQNTDKQWSSFKDALLLAMEETSPGLILDFGCGVGRFAETALTRADRYVGVDINEGAFQYAPENPRAEFVGLPGENIPFGNEHFDSAMSLTVLQHIVDPKQFDNWASEISRVVKPGGYFYIIDDASKKRKMGLHMKVRGPRLLSAALGATLDKDFGLISAEQKGSHHLFRARKQ